MPTQRVKNVDLSSEDGVVDLKRRTHDKDVGFAVHKIDGNSAEEPERMHHRFEPKELEDRMESFAEKLEQAVVKVSPADGQHDRHHETEYVKDLIKVKFEKFVQLVASRDFWQVLERHKDDDIIMSPNLLTELAAATDEKGEKKTPVIFLVGLAIGVVITYILISR